MSKQFKRAVRVADLIKREVAILFLNDINDPRLKGLNVTSVKLTDDLSLAKIYFVTHEDENTVLEVLEKVSGFIKKNLSKKLKLRKMPELHFYYDDVFENGLKIDKLLTNIKG